MMAPVKLIVALVALSAIALEVEAERGLWGIAHDLGFKMGQELSEEDKKNAEKAYSFAQNYISGLEEGEKQTADKLLKAWDRFLHEPDQCDELSLEYVATVARNAPSYHSGLRTLYEAINKYARECLTPDKIESAAELVAEANGFSTQSSFKSITEFIDDQFIADYWREHPKESVKDILMIRATKAIAKAIKRDSENNIKDLKDTDQVHAYLTEHLYRHCPDYYQAFNSFMNDIDSASLCLHFDHLISSLDKDTQNVFFRFRICNGSAFPIDFYRVSREVVSKLKRPFRKWW